MQTRFAGLIAAVCAGALWGCGQSPTPTPPSPAPSPVPAAWDNHFAAFGAGVAAQNDADPTSNTTAALDQIMLDYDELSVVRLYEYGAGLTTYTGTAAIRGMFAGLFPALAGCAVDVPDQTHLQAKVTVDDAGAQVFLVWSCEVASFFRATDTFIFDGAIIRNQNIVVAKTASVASKTESLVQVRRLQDYSPVSVTEAWTNHADAFMAGAAAGGDPARNQTDLDAAVTKIMLDYDESSVVLLFEQTSGLTNEFVTHTGTAEIETMFRNLFLSFTDATPPSVPQALVVDDPKQVFLIWSAAESSYNEATDTFIFDSAFKIHRQNIAIFTR